MAAKTMVSTMLAKKQEAGHPLGDEACGTEQLSRQHEAHNQTRGLDASGATTVERSVGGSRVEVRDHGQRRVVLLLSGGRASADAGPGFVSPWEQTVMRRRAAVALVVALVASLMAAVNLASGRAACPLTGPSDGSPV